MSLEFICTIYTFFEIKLTVEKPGDVRGRGPLGLAGYGGILAVPSHQVLGRVDQHGRRSCEEKNRFTIVILVC